MGEKDIIKVECPIENLDLDILGFIDHNITVNIIKDEKIVEKRDPETSKTDQQTLSNVKTLAVSLQSSRGWIMYSSLLILKKKYTAANTAKRNTEANVINNLHNKK